MLFLFYSTAQSKRQDRKHNNNNNMASNSALIHLNDVVCIMVGCVTLCVAFFGLFFVSGIALCATRRIAETLIS
jgi:hypothetical protein